MAKNILLGLLFAPSYKGEWRGKSLFATIMS
jgi:hypothetical protein